jgi:hypothetical protein
MFKLPGRSSALLAALGFAVACGPSSRASTGQKGDPTVAARIGDRAITLEEVDRKAIASNMAAYQELYSARRGALEDLIAEALLDREAASRSLSRDELVRLEITAKVTPVSQADVESFYNENRSRLGERTLDQMAGQVRQFLEMQNERMVRESLLERLKEKVAIEVALDPPRVPITVARNEPAKGPSDAKITIVEYSDFQ